MRTYLLRLAGTATLTIGCAHYPATPRLPETKPADRSEYKFENLDVGEKNSNSLFVCLAFSGGGTRAAALSYGVLQKLATTQIEWEGESRTLLDEVDCITSVSGGSFTAAYYALFREQIFENFRQRMLDRDIQRSLFWSLFNPITLVELASPYYGRIDLAAELYDKDIFEQKTFADLTAQKRRPFIILNSTDLTTGGRFGFTQPDFDLLGADLGGVSIGRAVAASSAFPFLLSPISLQNHQSPGWHVEETADLRKSVSNMSRDYSINRRNYNWARNRRPYLEEKKENPYLHLMDGGLADNIGIRALAYEYWHPRGFINQVRNSKAGIKKLVLLIVNAKAGGLEFEKLNEDESAPNLADVAIKTATVSMDNYSSETVELFKDLDSCQSQQNAMVTAYQTLQESCSQTPIVASPFPEIHVVDINLEATKDPERRRKLLTIGTNFSLEEADVDALINAAGDLLDGNPVFTKLINSLMAPAQVQPPVASNSASTDPDAAESR